MARILKLCLKTSDGFAARLIEDSKETADYTGYVPDFFPEDHYGDCVELDIDIDTGKIVNWKRPTKKELKQLDTNT
jgi:hypothetical protein